MDSRIWPGQPTPAVTLFAVPVNLDKKVSIWDEQMYNNQKSFNQRGDENPSENINGFDHVDHYLNAKQGDFAQEKVLSPMLRGGGEEVKVSVTTPDSFITAVI